MKLIFLLTTLLITVTNFTLTQWTEQYTNYSGQVYFYSVVMADESNGFVVGSNSSYTSGIIYRTTNGGEDWNEVPGVGPILYSVYSPAPNIALAVGQDGAIIKTTDGGNSWSNRPSGTTRTLNSVFFIDANTGWAAGGHFTFGNVILKTTDQGETWVEKLSPESDGLFRDIHFVNNEVGWAVGYKDGGSIIVKTTDGGETWQTLNSGVNDCRLETVFFLNENLGWVGGLRDYFGSPKVVLLKTTNGGDTWISQISNKLGTIQSLRMCDANRGWAVGLGDLWGNQYGLNYETDDGGYTWIHRTELDNCFMNSIFFLNPNTGWGNSLSSIYKYQPPSEYDLQFTSLADMNYARYGFGYTFDGNNIYSICGGIREAPWKSTSGERYNLASNTWTEFVTGLIPRRYCSAEYVSSQNKIYIFNGDTYTSTTYTDTVEIVDVGTGDLSYIATNPYPVEYGGSAVWNDKIYLFGGSNSDGFSNRLYEFDPLTNSWTRLPDMPEAKQTNGEIINGVLYVFGGYNGSVSKRIDAYNIQNSLWTSLGEMPVGVSAHATAKSGENIWIVGSYDNIKFLAVYDTETNDFSQLSSNMIGRRHAGARVVGNNLYIFGGNQESNSASTLKSLEYTDIIVSVDDKINLVISNFILNQNYPNPFNPTTVIKYYIPELSFVILKVYDVLGNEIATLVNEEKPAGIYKVEFDATGLPSGVYFYQLKTEGYFKVKKMILLR